MVAEGVETEGQNRILRELGRDRLKGFLFGKPMSVKALAWWSIGGVGPRSIQFRDSLFHDTQPPVVARISSLDIGSAAPKGGMCEEGS